VARARDASDKLDKARARARRSGSGGPRRLFVLDDSAVVVAVFPEDKELRVLARLATAGSRRGVLRRVLGPAYRESELVRLRYKPERRWVGRLSTDEGAVAVVKAYAPASFEAALRGSNAWRDQAPRRVPQVLGSSREHGLVVLEWIAGQPLAEGLLRGEAGAPEVAVTGEELACVHGQSAAGLVRRTPLDQADHALAVAREIAFVLPGLSARAERLAGEISNRLLGRAEGMAPVHGDFNAGQVVLMDDRAALIDFDEAAVAEPAADLGSFAADLERHACTGGLASARVQELSAALLEGYARRAALPPDTVITLYTAAALFSLAPHVFRTRDPLWPQRAEVMLDRVDALLHGRSARNVPGTPAEQIA
jgi:Ser/Thr protein kinase RdoA (MazF antagonist)